MNLKGALLKPVLLCIEWLKKTENELLLSYSKAIHNIKLSITSKPFLQTKSYLNT